MRERHGRDHHRERPHDRDSNRRLPVEDGGDDEEEDDGEAGAEPDQSSKAAPAAERNHRAAKGKREPEHRAPAFEVGEGIWLHARVYLDVRRNVDLEEPNPIAAVGNRVRHEQLDLLPFVRALRDLEADTSAARREWILAQHLDHAVGDGVDRRELPGIRKPVFVVARPEDDQPHNGPEHEHRAQVAARATESR